MLPLRAILNAGRRSLFARCAERRFARQASAELLELYKQLRREHPELSGRALYQAIVAQRLAPQVVSASELVRRAEESFTDWPQDRELKFRDVVHYLVFYECTLLDPARPGTMTNMGVVVTQIIPDDC